MAGLLLVRKYLVSYLVCFDTNATRDGIFDCRKRNRLKKSFTDAHAQAQGRRFACSDAYRHTDIFYHCVPRFAGKAFLGRGPKNLN